jgi:Fur family ferric uptake transcriptional regulator
MEGDVTEFTQTLRKAGLRVTQQRMLLLALLRDANDHPNAEELLARAKAVDDSISLATVYRTLSTLEEVGLIRKISLEGLQARYEAAPVAEHDHLVDVDTGEVIEIVSDEIARLRQELVAKLGYEIVSQQTLIRGRKVSQPPP